MNTEDEVLSVEVAHTVDGCFGTLDSIWNSFYCRCDFPDQGRHRLRIDSVRGDLLVEVGQQGRSDANVVKDTGLNQGGYVARTRGCPQTVWWKHFR